jgi:Fe-S oxidoreductase/nitrate reductase gamma subunit
MEPTRSEFLFMGLAHKVAFYALMAAAVAVLAWQVRDRIRLWMTGRPIGWKSDWLANFGRYVLGQRKVRTSREKSGAPMHLLIFYGFLTLFIGTTLLAINTYSPWKFHKGTYYLVYEFTLDIMGMALLVGLLWALARRGLAKPKSLVSSVSDFWTLILLLALTITGFFLEAFRMAAVPQPFDASAPVGHWIAQRLPAISPSAYIGLWWFHAILVAVFIAVLPQLRLRHILYAICSTAGAPPDPMGALPKVSIEEVEETGRIGAQKAEHYTRWHLLSLDACMECGRCTEVCPANGVGKTLDPRQVVQGIRGILGTDGEVAAAVTEEALWACTTCNACVEVCPVMIRHVDLIVDARRFLAAEGRLAGSAANLLRQLQSTESAWGAQASEREAWMDGHDVPLVRDLVSRGEKFDVLLWVGCAGVSDRNAMGVNRAFVGLLKKAGVRFACLGKEERCTGDPARRIGDEFLYQQFAESNIQTFEQYGVRTIVTACPHCFNTIRNEYPQFQGHYEVYHTSQFLAKLIEEGKLRAPHPAKGSVTLHDPCYLARVNQEADAPRRALGAESNLNEHVTPIDRWLHTPMNGGTQLAEPEHRAQKTLCCGAGGGRMWMEDPPEQRPSDRRVRELLNTGAARFAVACPFCHIMLEAGMQKVAPESGVEIVDIVRLVEEANAE